LQAEIEPLKPCHHIPSRRREDHINMAVSHARDPNWAAPLFCDAQKLASLVEELKERIEQQLENEKVSGSTHSSRVL
jgi:regulator of sirC expression with transglutaminase-like and TPR domain